MRCRNDASMPHREMGEAAKGDAPPFKTLILLREKRSMVMQRVTPRRTAIRKLQDQRAKDLEASDTRSECWPEEFDRPASTSPRFKPTLPKIGFLERPDLSKW